MTSPAVTAITRWLSGHGTFGDGTGDPDGTCRVCAIKQPTAQALIDHLADAGLIIVGDADDGPLPERVQVPGQLAIGGAS